MLCKQQIRKWPEMLLHNRSLDNGLRSVIRIETNCIKNLDCWSIPSCWWISLKNGLLLQFGKQPRSNKERRTEQFADHVNLTRTARNIKRSCWFVRWKLGVYNPASKFQPKSSIIDWLDASSKKAYQVQVLLKSKWTVQYLVPAAGLSPIGNTSAAAEACRGGRPKLERMDFQFELRPATRSIPTTTMYDIQECQLMETWRLDQSRKAKEHSWSHPWNRFGPTRTEFW